MPLVAGVDSSTQSCKVVILDLETGALVRHGRAPHPDSTEVHPDVWWSALSQAIEAAGGIHDVSGIAVAAQQHGMICLDEVGDVVRPAMLWNDPRPAEAAADLVAEWGAGETGRQEWIRAVGLVPQPFHTVARLRWLAEHETTNAARTAAVCLPHDWLTNRLLGSRKIAELVTDRSDASGTGYWSVLTGQYRMDRLRLALGHDAVVPGVLKPSEPAGLTHSGAVVGPGAGDNAAAALGIGAGPGDVIISIGTSGVVSAVAGSPIADPTGEVIDSADATGRFLRLATTPIAARVLDATAHMLGVGHKEFSRLALSAPPGSDGLVVLPYFEKASDLARLGASGVVCGLAAANSTPAHIARAAVEGMLCSLAEILEAMMLRGARPERLLLVGGAARSEAVRQIAPTVFGQPVIILASEELGARGAARQAAWSLTSTPEPPAWQTAAQMLHGEAIPSIRARFADARTRFLRWNATDRSR
jgi:xylulokinase